MKIHRNSSPDGCDHRRDNSWALIIRGVVITRYCEKCEDQKRRVFNVHTVHRIRTEEYDREDGYE